MKDVATIVMGIIAVLFVIAAICSSTAEIGWKATAAFILYFIIGGFINHGLQSYFKVIEDSPAEGRCTLAAMIITAALYYVFYKIYVKHKANQTAGLSSPKDYLFHKENIHEMNFKAQFANFRKEYNEYIEGNKANLFGKNFGTLINEVENKVMVLSKNPQNISDDIDYRMAVIDQIMLALLDKVTYGHYYYRGKPMGDTNYFISMYLKILQNEYEAGEINDEERKIAIDNLNYEIKNNG